MKKKRGRPRHIIVKNRVKELLDGHSQMWLVRKLAKTKTPLSKYVLFKIVNNEKNINEVEKKALCEVFEVSESELYKR